MSGNNVETAVGLYMVHEQTGGGGVGGGFGDGLGGGAAGGGGGSAVPMMGDGGREDGVRAPDVTRSMQLMDNPMGMPADPAFHMMYALMEEQLQQSAFAPPSVPVEALFGRLGRWIHFEFSFTRCCGQYASNRDL
jgi:hypothetical protein